jgi:hypothetical protein
MKNTRLLCGITLMVLLASCSSQPVPEDDQWEDDDLWTSGFNNHLTKDNKSIPNTLQRVEQYSNGILFNVAEYDSKHRLIFRYYKQDWGKSTPGRYATMIAAYVYKDNRLLKSYYLHSNIGLTLNCYSYKWFGTGFKRYSSVIQSARFETYQANSFRYLERIISYQALLRHPKVLELERKQPRQLSEEIVYGPSEQVQEVLYYTGKGEINSRSTYYYDNQGLLTRKHHRDERPNRPAYTRQFIREYNPQKQLVKEYHVTDNTDTAEYKQYSYD